MVDIDLIVVNYKTYDLIKKFAESYHRFKPTTPSRLILVDNSSDPKQLATVAGLFDVVLPSEENLGYARAANWGSTLSDSKYLAVLNSDTEFVNDLCVDRLVQYMEENDDVGVAGPFQYAPGFPKKVTHAGIFGTNRKPQHRGWLAVENGKRYRDVQVAITVSGSAYFVRREAWNKIRDDETFRKHWPNAQGAMPEHHLYYEESLVSYAMPKFGYKVVYVGDQGAEMIHHWNKSISKVPNNTFFQDSQKPFRALLDDWGIEHD